VNTGVSLYGLAWVCITTPLPTWFCWDKISPIWRKIGYNYWTTATKITDHSFESLIHADNNSSGFEFRSLLHTTTRRGAGEAETPLRDSMALLEVSSSEIESVSSNLEIARPNAVRCLPWPSWRGPLPNPEINFSYTEFWLYELYLVIYSPFWSSLSVFFLSWIVPQL